jgi:hemerythrin-like domain-containing protein
MEPIKAIQILMNEHRLIERGLKIMESVATYIAKNKDIPVLDLEELLDFTKNFADDFHHLKEENVLFKWMTEKGFPSEGGPIHCMLSDHDVGRDFVKKIEDEIKKENSALSREVITVSLIDLSNHLAGHIFKEDNVLYPMVTQIAVKNSCGDVLDLEAISDAIKLANEEIISRYNLQVGASKQRHMNKKYEDLIKNLESKYPSSE